MKEPATPRDAATAISRRCLVAGALGLAATKGVSAMDADPSREVPWSAGHLAGTLTLPAGDGRFPAALIIAGSGPTPRDGPHGLYARLARDLARAGIASLRYDKRGIGQSRPLVAREDELTVDLFVDDVVLAARDLAARPDISGIVLVGHSEGGLLSALAAPKVQPKGLVQLAGPGRPLGDILRQQIAGLPLPATHAHLRQEAYGLLDRLVRGERIADVPAIHAALFRPSIQPFLISMMKVDPARSLADVQAPLLLVRGESDIQVSAEDLRLLSAARPDAQVLSLPRTNHIFKNAPEDLSDRAAQLQSYGAEVPFVDELAPAIVGFIRRHAPA